jgi:peptidoglycan/LPS O-acetylase OafA/YrhL
MTAEIAEPPIEVNTDELDPDRRFRPDVEGLRAVAVAIVVLYHADIPGVRGGFVGVDVFFVISGYVITRMLLGQVDKRHRPQFIEFYARRARRILPAAGLVALVTVFATYHYLGFIQGNEVADDARWVAVFLANFHFASIGTDYFKSQLPPSPLQNFWSLAVEEQFYVVYPATIAVVTLAGRRFPIRPKMMIFTAVVFIASYAWSIDYTHTHATAAYFSISTRAWELALGGFIGAGTAHWKGVSNRVAAFIGWSGMALIAVSVVVITAASAYPGWIALLPVAGSGLVIVGGVAAPRFGPEIVLGTLPFRWIGKLSYSIYLWHWPLLTIAKEDRRTALPLGDRLGLVALSVILSALTFYLIEDRVRRARFLRRRPVLSIALGLVIVAVVLVVSTHEIHTHQGLL